MMLRIMKRIVVFFMRWTVENGKSVLRTEMIITSLWTIKPVEILMTKDNVKRIDRMQGRKSEGLEDVKERKLMKVTSFSVNKVQVALAVQEALVALEVHYHHQLNVVLWDVQRKMKLKSVSHVQMAPCQ